jgi:hypothetical protein
LAALKLMAAYFASPIPLPDELQNKSFDIDNTTLLENSQTKITAWVSKDSSLLKRIDVNSSMIETPEILNISEPDFRIESRLNESTIYSAFGQPMEIELAAI